MKLRKKIGIALEATAAFTLIFGMLVTECNPAIGLLCIVSGGLLLVGLERE